MDDFRKEGYKDLTNKIESKLKEDGLLKGEIAIIGYLLLSQNIEYIQKEIEINKGLISLIRKAEDLINRY